MTKKTQLDEITLKARVAKKLIDRLDSKLDKRQIELLGGLVDINNPEHREKLRNDDQYRRLNSVYTAAWFAKEKVPYRPYSKDKKLEEGALGIQSKRKAARSMAKRTFNSSVDPSGEYATLGAIGAGIGALGGPATAAIGGALGMGVVKVAKETDISRLAKNLKREPGIRTTEAKMRRREKVQELGDEAHQADKKSAWWAGLAAQVRKRVGWGGNTAAGRSTQALALTISNKWYKKGQKARDLKDKIGGLADKYTPGTYFEEFVESVKQLAEAKGISNREALKEMVLSEGLGRAITKIKKKLTVGKRIKAIEKDIVRKLSASYHTNKPWSEQNRRRLDLGQRSIRTFDIETNRTPTDDYNRGPYMKRKWKTVVPSKQKAITQD